MRQNGQHLVRTGNKVGGVVRMTTDWPMEVEPNIPECYRRTSALVEGKGMAQKGKERSLVESYRLSCFLAVWLYRGKGASLSFDSLIYKTWKPPVPNLHANTGQIK